MQVKKYRGVIIVSVLICLFVSVSVFATETNEYKLLVGLPEMAADTAPGLGGYLQNMFKIGIGIAGVLAVLMITIGGVQYMTAEAISGKSNAKSRINNAIFGLILALSSFLLLNEIDPNLTTSNLTLENVEAPPIIPPDPDPEVEYIGICTDGMPCGGETIGDCQADCETVCPKKIVMSTNCSENWWGEDYEGKCLAGDKSYAEKCGVGTANATACLASCESTCTDYSQIFQTCRKK